jgi:formylglycine-generating enzyme required for sulfatase activity
MGEGESEHKVYLDAYFIGKYEVTNAEWKAFTDATGFHPLPPYWRDGKAPNGKENHPVVWVSWEDVQKYCEWVSKGSGREAKLPTEAQWEKAARGPEGFI